MIKRELKKLDRKLYWYVPHQAPPGARWHLSGHMAEALLRNVQPITTRDRVWELINPRLRMHKKSLKVLRMRFWGMFGTYGISWLRKVQPVEWVMVTSQVGRNILPKTNKEWIGRNSDQKLCKRLKVLALKLKMSWNQVKHEYAPGNIYRMKKTLKIEIT